MGTDGRGLESSGSDAYPNRERDPERNRATFLPSNYEFSEPWYRLGARSGAFDLSRQRLAIPKIVDAWVQFLAPDNPTYTQVAKTRHYVEEVLNFTCPHVLSDEPITSPPPMHPEPIIALMDVIVAHSIFTSRSPANTGDAEDNTTHGGNSGSDTCHSDDDATESSRRESKGVPPTANHIMST